MNSDGVFASLQPKRLCKSLSRRKIMRLFTKKPRSAGDDETFVRLIQIARENPEIREKILGILCMDPFNRKSALNMFIEQMRLKGAPRDFISAVGCFLDDQVAEKALTILSKGSEKGFG